MYVNKKFVAETIMTLNTYDTWEGQVIRITKGGLRRPIIIANIYRPPKDVHEKYRQFIQEFTPILKTLENMNSEAIITGELNIDLLKINEREVFSDFFDTLTENSFYPKITFPTRFSNKHGTLLDNFFCKLTDSTLNTTSGILIKIIPYL
jgi:exonuclease III